MNAPPPHTHTHTLVLLPRWALKGESCITFFRKRCFLEQVLFQSLPTTQAKTRKPGGGALWRAGPHPGQPCVPAVRAHCPPPVPAQLWFLVTAHGPEQACTERNPSGPGWEHSAPLCWSGLDVFLLSWCGELSGVNLQTETLNQLRWF